jgi:hypothetical protein
MPTPKAQTPHPSTCRILIVSANVLGISILEALRAAGHFNCTVWEREHTATESRSIVRTIKRLSATLVVDCRDANGCPRSSVHTDQLYRRGPYTHTVVCDGVKHPKKTEGTQLWGTIYTPALAIAHLISDQDKELRRPVQQLLDGVNALTRRTGFPLSNPALRLADPTAMIEFLEPDIPEEEEDHLSAAELEDLLEDQSA